MKKYGIAIEGVKRLSRDGRAINFPDRPCGGYEYDDYDDADLMAHHLNKLQGGSMRINHVVRVINE